MGALATAGVDVPVSERVTASTGVNASFGEERGEAAQRVTSGGQAGIRYKLN